MMKSWWTKIIIFPGMLLTVIAMMFPHVPLSFVCGPSSGMVGNISGSVFPVKISLNIPFMDPEADPVVIPMKQAGRLFLIDARIDGIDGNLVFDTGAKELVLNSTYFRNHTVSRKLASAGITGEVAATQQITAGQVEFAQLIFTKLTAEMTDLGHIENRRGVKILGLLGFSMLKNYEIVIDAVHSELRLYKIDRTGKRVSGLPAEFTPHHTQKIEGSGNILFLNGNIGGKTMKFCFDTAAETNVISKSSNKAVLGTLTITRRMELKGAGSGTSEVLFGRMNDFTIGNREISNMETVVASLYALNEAYNTHIDGILGYSFLQHAMVCVNFKKSQVGITFTEGEDK